VVKLGLSAANVIVAHSNATMLQAPFWQAVDRVTKKVSNFNYLMRAACAAGSVFWAIGQASITQIEEDPL
jgi:hypothetical protein